MRRLLAGICPGGHRCVRSVGALRNTPRASLLTAAFCSMVACLFSAPRPLLECAKRFSGREKKVGKRRSLRKMELGLVCRSRYATTGWSTSQLGCFIRCYLTSCSPTIQEDRPFFLYSPRYSVASGNFACKSTERVNLRPQIPLSPERSLKHCHQIQSHLLERTHGWKV